MSKPSMSAENQKHFKSILFSFDLASWPLE